MWSKELNMLNNAYKKSTIQDLPKSQNININFNIFGTELQVFIKNSIIWWPIAAIVENKKGIDK